MFVRKCRQSANRRVDAAASVNPVLGVYSEIIGGVLAYRLSRALIHQPWAHIVSLVLVFGGLLTLLFGYGSEVKRRGAIWNYLMSLFSTKPDWYRIRP
jgi:hypothetical protein